MNLFIELAFSCLKKASSSRQPCPELSNYPYMSVSYKHSLVVPGTEILVSLYNLRQLACRKVQGAEEENNTL